MIPIKDTNLCVVEARKDYESPSIGHVISMAYFDLFPPKGKGEKMVHDFSENDRFKILGEVTADTVNFDVTPFVMRTSSTTGHNFYKDYTKDSVLNNARESFLSLLEANGVYFNNPMELPIEPLATDYFRVDIPINCLTPEEGERLGEYYIALKTYEDKLDQYTEYLSKVIEKAVILKKK